MGKKDLHGGSTNWWPPSGDHVILYRANPLRFEHFDQYLDTAGTALKYWMWAAAEVMPVNILPDAKP